MSNLNPINMVARRTEMRNAYDILEQEYEKDIRDHRDILTGRVAEIDSTIADLESEKYEYFKSKEWHAVMVDHSYSSEVLREVADNSKDTNTASLFSLTVDARMATALLKQRQTHREAAWLTISPGVEEDLMGIVLASLPAKKRIAYDKIAVLSRERTKINNNLCTYDDDYDFYSAILLSQ